VVGIDIAAAQQLLDMYGKLTGSSLPGARGGPGALGARIRQVVPGTYDVERRARAVKRTGVCCRRSGGICGY